MKKVIYNKIDKHAVTEMPRAVFEGRIFVITTERDADRAVEYLLTQPILGIDTETRPAFRKGKQYKVALLQVATYDTCFLFRLNNTGMTKSIIRLLEDESIPKIGLSLHDDIISLHKRAEFKPFCAAILCRRVARVRFSECSRPQAVLLLILSCLCCSV